MGKCKDCKYYEGYEKEAWEADISSKGDEGTCNCPKFVCSDELPLMAKDADPLYDRLEYLSVDGDDAGFYVGANFGCIHYEPKEE